MTVVCDFKKYLEKLNIMFVNNYIVFKYKESICIYIKSKVSQPQRIFITFLNYYIKLIE